MTVHTVPHRRRRRSILRLVLATLWLTLAGEAKITAAQPAGQRFSLAIDAGQSYVIENLKQDSRPAIKIEKNPHALIVHDEKPGELLLLGAEAGHWLITVELNNGATAMYDVTVRAIAKPGEPLAPGQTAPESETEVIGSPELERLPDAQSPSSTALDAGAGPVGGSRVKIVTPSGEAPRLQSPTSHDSLAAAGAPARAQTEQSPPLLPPPSPGAFRTNPPALGRSEVAGSQSSRGTPLYLPADAITLMAGSSLTFSFAQRLKRIAIADTKVADVEVINPRQLMVVGHQPGFTTLALWDEQDNYEARQVHVELNGKEQVMLDAIVAELNRTNLENQGINYSAALRNYGVSLVSLPGLVASPFSGSSTGSGAINTLPEGGAIIPLLLSSHLTYGLAGQNSNVATQALFQFLEDHGLAKILSQPRLLANSGEKATFLSGGEIPIVIAQALNTSVVFKEFGTSVKFVPTVVGRNDIELAVKPEVSEPDFSQGVQLFGFTVPAFITRRAETFVRLHDDQTLIIAGLILHTRQSQVDKVPYLGDVPLLGGLFRNTSYQDTETDLVISVTPHIVGPLPAGASVALPTSVGAIRADEIRTRRLDSSDASRPRF